MGHLMRIEVAPCGTNQRRVKLHRRAALGTISWEAFKENINFDMRTQFEEHRPSLMAYASDKFESAKGRLLLAGSAMSTSSNTQWHQSSSAISNVQTFLGHPTRAAEGAKNLCSYLNMMVGRKIHEFPPSADRQIGRIQHPFEIKASTNVFVRYRTKSSDKYSACKRQRSVSQNCWNQKPWEKLFIYVEKRKMRSSKESAAASG